jgi:hypothetical protein
MAVTGCVRVIFAKRGINISHVIIASRMEAEQQQAKRRPVGDFVHLIFAVPSTFIFKQDEDSEDEDMGKEVHYKLYASGGYKEQALREVLTEDFLRSMGIEGPVSVTHKRDPAWGRKSTRIDDRMTMGLIQAEYADEPGKCRCTMTLKPLNQIWYECIRLTDDEVALVRQKVIDGVDMRRITKKQKTTQ